MLSLLITGDEEGEAWTAPCAFWNGCRQQHKIPDFCVVGEPTSRARLGDVVKIGRRGSLNATITMRAARAMPPIRIWRKTPCIS